MTYNNLRIPTYALSYLINGDNSGLDDQDKQNIDSYMSKFYNLAEDHDGYVIFSQENEEEYFSSHPEFGLACNVQDCIILIVAG